ncbi:hypothetical protein [Sphingopyxis sp. USTB-05]|uniref:hypothetical protein n=1 Tax=Sphingopyxis sp. USTB-05 TaxID=2830667 RepID=UPI002078AEE8|nr:hypothetical protein [Sphingopyxis sp. USTB-05]USI77599.1 hypothetical protein KEC45_01400 [Sphingopyxis sp. USTB-05]
MTDVPTAFRGLWQRQVITAPGYRDETTKVFWLQTDRWFVDLRVPEGVLAIDAESLSQCSKEQLLQLADVQAFVGTLTVRNDILHWIRIHDRHPPTGILDEAYCEIRSNILIENGMHANYQEIWEKLTPRQAPTEAFLLDDGGFHTGVLVMVGDHLMEFVVSADAAPAFAASSQGVSSELVCGRRPEVEAWLGDRVRYARRSSTGEWETVVASLPWLVGKAFSVELFDADDQCATRTARLSDTRDCWRAATIAAGLQPDGDET